MKKKNIAKAAAAAFIAANITATVVPVYADESDDSDVTKDESVYTVLNADGSVNEITVSDQLHSEDGFNNYDDKSDLKDVQNLKSEDPVKTSKDGFVWNSKDKDIYYQGTSTKDLPMDIKITYTMDGKEATAKSLLGKSGHIQIKIAVDNKQKQTFESNGKKYDLATPFVTVAGAMLDQDKFSNVEINEGTVTSDSSHNIAAAVMIPGLKDGLSSVMDSDIYSAISSYLIDDITIDADVTDFESPTIMLAAATSTDKLKDELGDVDIPDISSQLDQLQDATNQLIDGSQSLYDGAVKLDDGTGTLLNGINALSSGANTLASGADKVSAGAASLQNGLGQLSSNSAALNAGMVQLENGILETANDQLGSNDATKNLPKLTMSNYAEVLGGITGAKDTRDATLAEIAKQAGGLDTNTTRQLIYMTAIANPNEQWDQSKLTTAMTAQGARMQSAAEVQSVVGNINSKDDALKDADIGKLMSAVKQDALKNPSADDMNKVYAGIAAQVKAVVPTLTDDQANAVVTYALHTLVAQRVTPDANSLKATLASIAQQAQQNPQAAQAVLTKAATDYADYKNDQLYSAFANGVYQSNVNALDNSALYDQLSLNIKNIQSNIDDASTAKLIVYTARNFDSTKPETYKAQLTNAAVKLQDAQNVATEMGNASTDNGTVVVNTVLDAMFTVSPQYQSIQKLENSLGGVKFFAEKLKEYTDGVDTVYAGSKDLASGASQVASGASQLKNGISQLQAGAKTLKSGSDTLASGAKTLLDGLNQYNDEAISKLTNNEKITTLQDAADLFTVIEENADDYNNYSGISEGTDGSVKFVYKVEGEKEDKKSNEADDSTKKDNRSFWERVVDLFNFSDLF